MPIQYSSILVLIIVIRVIFIPHGAYLQSVGKYHERKIIEGAFYFFSSLYVWFAVKRNTDFNEIILVLNVFITLSSVVFYFRARYLSCPALSFLLLNRKTCASVLEKSFPYFLNNGAGLIVYGGFVGISAFVISVNELARIALLHSMLFTNIYQGFDLIFRTVLIKIKEKHIYEKLKKLIFLTFFLIFLFWFFTGKSTVHKIFPNFVYQSSEIYIYLCYMFLEILYLLKNTKMQMSIEMSKELAFLSILKAILFLAFVAVAFFWAPISMTNYLLLLVCWSALNLLAFFKVESVSRSDIGVRLL